MFGVDDAGNLVAPGGALVQGWSADPLTGEIDTDTALGNINLPITDLVGGQATANVSLGGNLDSSAEEGTEHTTTFQVFDSLGNTHDVVVTFTKSATANTWDVGVTVGEDDASIDVGTLAFDTFGELLETGPTEIVVTGPTPPDAEQIAFTIDLADPGGLVQFAGLSSAEGVADDGKSLGSLRGYSFGEDGSLVAQFSNGQAELVAQVAIAAFQNPNGLIRQGDTFFAASLSSGDPTLGEAGTGNRGLISPGSLEMSNVDLALEFTNLIIAQRGFQANGRIISASDEMLADLVNLKR